MDMRIMRASEEDAEEIYALYHSLIDMPYSTWDEDYPTREIVQEDVTRHAVLVMRSAEDEIVAAIAIRYETEFADAAPWYADVTRWATLARLGVYRAWQGQGIAGRMMTAAMDLAKADGPCTGPAAWSTSAASCWTARTTTPVCARCAPTAAGGFAGTKPCCSPA